MAAAASRIMLKLPIRLIWMTFVKRSSGWGPSLPTVLHGGPMPAQLTSPISSPISSAAATAAWASATAVTLQRTKRAGPPSWLANSAPSCWLTSAISTLPPSATIRSAVAPPSPDAPPVTMTTLPFTSIRSASVQDAHQGNQKQRHDVDDLDQRVHRGAGGVLVRIADRVAGDRRL